MKNKRTKYLLGMAIPFFLLVLLIGMSIKTWQSYLENMMDNQKEQLMMVAEVLGKNMEASIGEYEDDLHFLAEIVELNENQDVAREYYKKYIQTQRNYVKNLFIESENQSISWMLYEVDIRNPVMLTRTDYTTSIWLYEDILENKYMVFKQKLTSGENLCLVMQGEEYYQDLIRDIKVGTNGYIVVKNSDGIIIMHPEIKQWGCDVINGRRQLYGELDFSSLEHLIEKQEQGMRGIDEYYSYWWINKNLPRVKKLSAYVPAQIGDDFWIISAVIDYSDFYQPIQDGMSKMVIIFIGIALLFGALALHAGRMIIAWNRTQAEVVYLKELNSLLEEVQRNEAVIAHQQRLQIMGTMTGGIAHEFNNFLTPIMGYAELLMMELPEDSEQYDCAEEIYEASEKAKDIVRQISTLSRKNVETVYRNIDVQRMIVRAMKMVESVCPANVHLETKITLDKEQILGNTTQINQVILNICVNAIHAIGRKEGLIRVWVSCVPIEELIKKNLEFSGTWKKYIQIEIRDNGCGMDSETLQQIFDPFFTTKKSGEGTGLGLSLAEQIIMSHRGRIAVESIKGQGSCFYIYIPVLENADEPIIHSSHESTNLIIAAADDNPKILELLRRNFQKLGQPVIACRTKEELSEVLQQQEIDVLLIDETLKNDSGIDFCMLLQGRYPKMKKLIMTNIVTREIAEAKSKGIIDGYVEKPVSVSTILENLRLDELEY